MSSVFGKKDSVAKSWSDMWEEDEEESEREEAAQKSRREQNSRGWSHESIKKAPVAPGVLREKKSCSALNTRPSRPKMHIRQKSGSTSNENDPYGWKVKTPKRSPKQVPSDKWAALGDRRRNFQTEPEITPVTNKKRSMTSSSRKKSGCYDHQGWNRRDSRSKNHPAHINHDWRLHKSVDSSPDDDHHEWVGGWHNFLL